MDEQEIPTGIGTGFIWDARGYVVTNYHVVKDGSAFKVQLADKTEFDATQVGVDPFHDVAVLKIEPNGKTLPALTLGRSNDLLVGQKVFAIGNPFGLDQTLTTGIISALGREITAPTPQRTPIQNVIQTDASINPGNSGGPLLDSEGRVIGMNTQIASPSGASAGIGFAIPIDTINHIVPAIIRTGHYERPALGIRDMRWGALTRDVYGAIFGGFAKGSGAELAGLKPSRIAPTGQILQMGDVITAVDDQKLEAPADLFRILDSREIGQEVDVSYLRDGTEHRTKVKLVGVE
jgi:S1-C subfamily serine protease